jgi:hypothetical protein
MHIKSIRGKAYAYQSIRLPGGGNSTSRCLGAHTLDVTLVVIKREGLAERLAAREAERKRVKTIAELDGEVGEVERVLARTADLMIEAAGYHRIKRGPWRRQRTMNRATAQTQISMQFDAMELAHRLRRREPEACREMNEITAKGKQGDAEAVAKFRMLCRADPEVGRKTTTALLEVTQSKILDDLFDEKNRLARTVLEAHLLRMGDELAGVNPSAIERLLVDRVVLCWLQLYRADYDEAATSGQSPTMVRLRVYRQSQAHKRFLSAIKALAEVRKLPIVALQVNVNSGVE